MGKKEKIRGEAKKLNPMNRSDDLKRAAKDNVFQAL